MDTDRHYERIVLVGASRGIGAAAARHLAHHTTDLITVSRTPAVAGRWIAADVATDDGLARVIDAAGGEAVDALLYLGGIWEAGAFTDGYAFAASTPAEVRNVIAVNLVAPILLAQALAPSLARAPNPRIVLMGATSGLENAGDVEVAYTASKFGLRGAAEAMAIALRPAGIAVTVINPANVGTDEVMDDIASGAFGPQTPIPLRDVLRTIDFVLACDPATVPSSVTLHQARPGTDA